MNLFLGKSFEGQDTVGIVKGEGKVLPLLNKLSTTP
jgi:hypothetical protein